MKKFNVTGLCIPKKHYMADTSDKIEWIVKNLIEEDEYFTINRARQYGKTTTLNLLYHRLKKDYYVLDLSFETADEYFVSQEMFVRGLLLDIGAALKRAGAEQNVIAEWEQPLTGLFPMRQFGEKITQLCREASKEIILLIDEVDKSSDNQIFLNFLGLLRDKYLMRARGRDYTFKSVILAGVYDIKNMKQKLRPQEEHKFNSPWNIAVDFELDMSFSEKEIAAMLEDYEADHHYGIDIPGMSRTIHDYTSGYPYLVSRICQLLDKSSTWNQRGLLQAVKLILTTPSTLFDDMNKKLADYTELNRLIRGMLVEGISYSYSVGNDMIQLGTAFGFLKVQNDRLMVANRIFETYLYNKYISEIEMENTIYRAGDAEKSWFLKDSALQMDTVLERFRIHYNSLYCEKNKTYMERECRFLFLTFLKPIINGTGNYYIEAETRDQRRTDIIVDYLGRQYIIELKIWHGKEYQQAGRSQLCGYLDRCEARTGWLVTFCFNKNKKELAGRREYQLEDKRIVEFVI